MSVLLPLIEWNIVSSAVLAVAVFIIGRWPLFQQRPALMHLLWFGVLARLMIPAVVSLPLLPDSPLKFRVEADFSQPLTKTLAFDFVPATPGAPLTAVSDVTTPQQKSKDWDWPAMLMVGSLAVSVCLASLSFIRYRRLLNVIANAEPAPKHVVEKSDEIARSMRLKLMPDVKLIEGLPTPSVIGGVSRATILLPRRLIAEIDEVALACVLTHEIAHLKRRDHWFNLTAAIVLYLFWWNPIAWWAWHEMRNCQEACCDATALAGSQLSRRRYAETLLRVLESWNQHQPDHLSALIGFGQQTSLTRRFEMIANPSIRQSTSLITTVGLIVLGLTFFCAPASAQKKENASAAPTEKKEKEKDVVLKYDDGTPDGKRSIAGTGEMIEFELPDEGYALKSVKLHCARYGTPKPPKEDAEFTIVSADESSILHTELVPYASFKRGDSRWTTITFQKAVTVPKKFWLIVDFNAEQTKGVYLSFDTSSGGKHSKTGVAGGDSEPVKIGGDWMIQAVVVKE